MTTHATVAVNAARKAVYDKFESQIHTFHANLATVKAKAETAKADAELKVIADEFNKSIKAIEAKINKTGSRA
jgi:wobble nucleotide-excising tRNase